MDRGAEPVERGKRLRHAIAHVAFEAVTGMGGAEARHQPVARNFGDDRRRGDRSDETVAADDGLAVAAGIDAVATVDEDKTRFYRQSGNGASERPQRRA